MQCQPSEPQAASGRFCLYSPSPNVLPQYKVLHWNGNSTIMCLTNQGRMFCSIAVKYVSTKSLCSLKIVEKHTFNGIAAFIYCVPRPFHVSRVTPCFSLSLYVLVYSAIIGRSSKDFKNFLLSLIKFMPLVSTCFCYLLIFTILNVVLITAYVTLDSSVV